MKKIFPIICALIIIRSVVAQNIGLDYSPLRLVDSKIYSLQPIYDWLQLPRSDKQPRPMQEWVGVKTSKDYSLDYKVIGVLPEGVLLVSSGELFGALGYGTLEKSDYDAEPILLKNYPNKDNLTDGQKINFLAIRSGNFQYTSADNSLHTIAAYDYGKHYIALPPTPEQVTAQKKLQAEAKLKAAESAKDAEARALKANQNAAANGDSFGFLRMGERYRDGDGVEKDLSKAREFFEKSYAADTNNFVAKEELSKLPPP